MKANLLGLFLKLMDDSMFYALLACGDKKENLSFIKFKGNKIDYTQTADN